MIDDTTIAHAILSARSDAIIAADRDGLITFWNPGAERIFGYTRGEAMGQSLDIIIPERLRERHWEGYRRVMASGKSRYGEDAVLAVPGIRRDGSSISIEFTLAPVVEADGRITGLVAVLRDVTARFEELRALKRKVAGVT